MYKFLEKYPKEFGVVLCILILQQHIYSTVEDYAKSLEILEWFDEKYFLINGITLFVGGFLANNYTDFRLTLRNAMVVIVGGGVLVFTNNIFGSMLGVIIFQMASCTFFITIFIRVGEYVNSVNALKIKSFLLSSFLLGVPLMGFFLVRMIFTGIDFIEGTYILLITGVIAVVYLILKLKPSKIPKPINGQKNEKFIFVLIGVIFISILGSVNAEVFQILEPEDDQGISLLLFFFILSFIVFGGVANWVFGKNNDREIDIIKALIWGLSILMLLYFVDFVALKFGYQSVITFTTTISFLNYEVLFIPILLTILTHNYLERAKGIVLGGFFGSIYLGRYFFISNINIESYQYFTLIMISIILLIIPSILKYRKELEETLRINKSQEFEPTEEKLADPFDHLIEK